MSALLQKFSFAFIGLFVLSSFTLVKQTNQKDTGLLVADTISIVQDSLLVKDTLLIKYIPIIPKTFIQADAWYLQSIPRDPKDSSFNLLKLYLNFFAQKKNAYQLYNQKITTASAGEVLYKIEQKFALPDKDLLFYVVIGLLFLYGFIIQIAPQYISKLFSQFSQSSLRMIQNREQLLQNSLASLIMNIGFIMSFSLLATLIIFNAHLLPINFWEGFLYMCLFFLSLYIGKFFCLTIAGYIFNTNELVQTYIFVVFMINKVLGILFIPFIAILAFARPVLHPFATWGSGFLMALLILYRYLFSLTSVSKKILISQAKPESEKSPYFDLERKYNVSLFFKPFIELEPIGAKEFRKTKIEIASYSAVIFTSKNAIDHFFRTCDELKINISQDTKYFCITESVALYLQKFIMYRKRKVFFGADGSNKKLFDVLNKHKANEQFLYVCSENQQDNEIVNWLKDHACTFDLAYMYRSVSSDIKPLLKEHHFDIICLFTPSGLKSLFDNQPGFVQNGTTLAAFGSNTCKAIEDAGLNLHIKVPSPQVSSMFAGLDQFLAQGAKKK
ncbi:MAG: DUF4271 domain-containing protein [Chitinophagia bacterium]|nr:DUF4271 domain-containing protein [Chitinophagia bacterium]